MPLHQSAFVADADVLVFFSGHHLIKRRGIVEDMTFASSESMVFLEGLRRSALRETGYLVL